MRIILVGSASQYAIEKPYLNYLSRHQDVSAADLFAAQNLFLEYYRKNILNRIKYRLGVSRILHVINDKLKQRILEFNPDVVFVFKGMEVLPGTLRWIKSRRIKVVNYNPDNPFIFSGKGSGNKNVTDSIGLYDLHFTYDAAIQERLLKEYSITTKILPFGFDIPEPTVNKCLSQAEVKRVCFLGNPDRERAQFIYQLASGHVAIDVYGNDWKRFLDHPNVKAHDPVYGEELWTTLARYRVQLNLMRIHNPSSHNMRTFEVPAVGGILLAPQTVDHATFFSPGNEIFLYTSVGNCLEQIKSILRLSTQEAQRIRKAAQRKSIESGYTYQDRAAQVVSEFKNLLGG